MQARQGFGSQKVTYNFFVTLSDVKTLGQAHMEERQAAFVCQPP